MKTSISGIILRVAQKQITADFYAKIGLNFREHSHGGPLHYECLDISPAFVAEIYQSSPAYPDDALMLTVESISEVLDIAKTFDISPRGMIKETDEIRFIYITDPDGHDVMLVENKS